MSIESVFPSTEAMEQLLAMGQEEGMKEAMGQIDAILWSHGRHPSIGVLTQPDSYGVMK